MFRKKYYLTQILINSEISITTEFDMQLKAVTRYIIITLV